MKNMSLSLLFMNCIINKYGAEYRTKLFQQQNAPKMWLNIITFWFSLLNINIQLYFSVSLSSLSSYLFKYFIIINIYKQCFIIVFMLYYMGIYVYKKRVISG